MLLLREQGYTVAAAVVWFAETRTRHVVELSDDHLAEARGAVDGVSEMAGRGVIPPPLVEATCGPVTLPEEGAPSR